MKVLFKNLIFMIQTINKYSKSYIFVIFFVSLTAFVGPISTVLAPKLIVESLMVNSGFNKILLIILFVAVINILRSVARSVFNDIYVPSNQLKVKKGINYELMRKAEMLDIYWFDNSSFYDKYTRALNQAENGFVELINTITTLFDRFFYVVTVISLIAILDPNLMFFSILAVIVLFVFGKMISDIEYKMNKITTFSQRRSDYTKRVYYLPEYAKELRVDGIGSLLKKYYIEAIIKIQKVKRKLGKNISILRISSEGLRVIILQFITMIYLVLQINAGKLDISDFIILFLATTQLSYEFYGFANCFTGFYKSSLYIKDLKTILEYKCEIENSGSEYPGNKISNMSLDNVSFRYDEDQDDVIKNISMHFNKGEKVAILGKNGSGKTTLVKLLLRLYDVNNGKIYLNKNDIRKYKVSNYRNLFGIVYQDYKFYSLSIAENVLLRTVKNDTDEAVVIKALKHSGLYTDVENLPLGIHTIVNKEFDDNGVVFSGGQAQKLALARMFARKDKQILVLDEVSSSLDPIAEYNLNKKILEHSKDKMLILISHRLSTTKDFDRIYLIDEGKIIEQGTHDDLINQNGTYAKMFKIQSEKYFQS